MAIAVSVRMLVPRTRRVVKGERGGKVVLHIPILSESQRKLTKDRQQEQGGTRLGGKKVHSFTKTDEDLIEEARLKGEALGGPRSLTRRNKIGEERQHSC